MKFILDNWMLIAVAMASGAMLLWPLIQGAASAGLDPASAVQLINREKGVVIDVCDPTEFAAGHVAAAVLGRVPARERDGAVPRDRQLRAWKHREPDAGNGLAILAP